MSILWSGLTAGGKVSGSTAEKRSNQIYSNAFYNSSGSNMHDIARQKSHQNNKDDDKALYQEILILYLVLPPTLHPPFARSLQIMPATVWQHRKIYIAKWGSSEESTREKSFINCMSRRRLEMWLNA